METPELIDRLSQHDTSKTVAYPSSLCQHEHDENGNIVGFQVVNFLASITNVQYDSNEDKIKVT